MIPGDPVAVHWTPDGGVPTVTRGRLRYVSSNAVFIREDNSQRRIPWPLITKVRQIT